MRGNSTGALCWAWVRENTPIKGQFPRGLVMAVPPVLHRSSVNTDQTAIRCENGGFWVQPQKLNTQIHKLAIFPQTQPFYVPYTNTDSLFASDGV